MRIDLLMPQRENKKTHPKTLHDQDSMKENLPISSKLAKKWTESQEIAKLHHVAELHEEFLLGKKKQQLNLHQTCSLEQPQIASSDTSSESDTASESNTDPPLDSIKKVIKTPKSPLNDNVKLLQRKPSSHKKQTTPSKADNAIIDRAVELHEKYLLGLENNSTEENTYDDSLMQLRTNSIKKSEKEISPENVQPTSIVVTTSTAGTQTTPISSECANSASQVSPLPSTTESGTSTRDLSRVFLIHKRFTIQAKQKAFSVWNSSNNAPHRSSTTSTRNLTELLKQQQELLSNQVAEAQKLRFKAAVFTYWSQKVSRRKSWKKMMSKQIYRKEFQRVRSAVSEWKVSTVSTKLRDTATKVAEALMEKSVMFRKWSVNVRGSIDQKQLSVLSNLAKHSKGLALLSQKFYHWKNLLTSSRLIERHRLQLQALKVCTKLRDVRIQNLQSAMNVWKQLQYTGMLQETEEEGQRKLLVSNTVRKFWTMWQLNIQTEKVSAVLEENHQREIKKQKEIGATNLARACSKVFREFKIEIISKSFAKLEEHRNSINRKASSLSKIGAIVENRQHRTALLQSFCNWKIKAVEKSFIALKQQEFKMMQRHYTLEIMQIQDKQLLKSSFEQLKNLQAMKKNVRVNAVLLIERMKKKLLRKSMVVWQNSFLKTKFSMLKKEHRFVQGLSKLSLIENQKILKEAMLEGSLVKWKANSYRPMESKWYVILFPALVALCVFLTIWIALGNYATTTYYDDLIPQWVYHI